MIGLGMALRIEAAGVFLNFLIKSVLTPSLSDYSLNQPTLGLPWWLRQ